MENPEICNECGSDISGTKCQKQVLKKWFKPNGDFFFMLRAFVKKAYKDLDKETQDYLASAPDSYDVGELGTPDEVGDAISLINHMDYKGSLVDALGRQLFVSTLITNRLSKAYRNDE